MVYDQEKQKGNANRATLAVARKMVAYLVAVDRRQEGFLVVEKRKPQPPRRRRAERQSRISSARSLPGLA